MSSWQRPKEDWQPEPNGPLALAVDLGFKTYWGGLEAQLRDEFNSVNDLLKRKELPDVRLDGGRLHVAALAAGVPRAADELGDRLYALVPRIKITRLLLEVATWTGFDRTFTHLRDDTPPENRCGVLTVVLADAINLGITGMAATTPGYSERQLAWLAEWYVRDDTYRAALAAIVNFQTRLPLARLWGDGTTSSSDEQRYRTGAHGRSTGTVNARYGNEPGMTFYTHLGDQYTPFHTKVSATNARDATHVLDGLLYHETDLDIEERSTDTHGYADHVFGMMPLLGFRFAPRIRDLADLRLYTPGKIGPWQELEALVGGKLNTRLVEVNWDEVLRLAASIRAGTCTASLMLGKLGSYARRSSLANALRELGRAQRTLFTLAWLQSPELRRRVLRGLNKGESPNSLKRAVFFRRGGEVRDRRLEAQAHRASGLNLVAAAISAWNTAQLGQVVERLREHGEDVPDELLAHVSPLRWGRIGLTGDYVWPEQP